jgi:hypothetical protein
LLFQPVRIGLLAYAPKDTKSATDKDLAGGKSDSSGCAGDDYVWHIGK